MVAEGIEPSSLSHWGLRPASFHLSTQPVINLKLITVYGCRENRTPIAFALDS